MALDQEAIKKRFSQLELDINNMNKLIDDNLQIGETVEGASEEEVGSESDEIVETTKGFSQLTGEAAAEFVSRAGTPDAEDVEGENVRSDKVPETPEVSEAPEIQSKSLLEHSEEKAGRGTVERTTEVSAEKVERPGQMVETVQEMTVTKDEEKTKIHHEKVEKRDTEVVKIHDSEEPVGEERNSEPCQDSTEQAVDQSTDTSEDFTAGNITTTISSNSSFSSPAEPPAPIFLPKNNAQSSGLRRPTNPFRVVSVGTQQTDTSASRKSSGESPADGRALGPDGSSKLQKRLDYLTKKCLKLRKEIQYLNDMNYQSTLSIEDGRRLSSAIAKLQEYLDTKTKEKYDLGVLVSRQLRRDIDRGENGQFWIGTK